MRLEQITQYVKADYAILIAVLYCLGRGLKSIRRFSNQLIPLALTLAGVLLACLSALSRSAEYVNAAAAVFDGLVQGILCAGMAVYLNQFLGRCNAEQEKDKKDSEKEQLDEKTGR